ncbi:MAG: extracellular solute-binding protein, partial [Spirochaetaceae bacterium]
SAEGTVQENKWVDWIRQDSGINVEFYPVPRWEVTETLNPAFAAGVAPDVINDYSRDNMALFHSQGVLAPLDDWIEQYAPRLKAYLDDNPALEPFLRFGDDNRLYAVTNMRPLHSIANHQIWIRKDWLDNLGLEIPSTEEEFFAVADAFVNDDPNQSGENDTFAFADGHPYTPIVRALYAGGGHNRKWLVDDDGNVMYARTAEQTLDYLRFHKMAQDRGWVDPELITDPNFERQVRLWVTDRAGIYFGQVGPPQFDDLKANVPHADIVPMLSFETAHGRHGLFQEPPTQRYIALNAEIENPQLALEYLEWHLFEGWFTLQFGFEGEHHEIDQATGLPQYLIFGQERTDRLNYNVEYRLLHQFELPPGWFAHLAPEDDPHEQERARLQEQALQTQLSVPYRRDMPYRPSMRELLAFYDEFDPVFDDIFDQVVRGDETPEWGYEQTLSEWSRLGGPRMEEIVQEWYDLEAPGWGDWRLDLEGMLAEFLGE